MNVKTGIALGFGLYVGKELGKVMVKTAAGIIAPYAIKASEKYTADPYNQEHFPSICKEQQKYVARLKKMGY